jgi:hypothetical protein
LEEYELTATELRLLDLAVQTLTLAQDTTLTPQERLAATGRYQMLVKQLRLEDVNGEEEKAPHGDVRPFRRIG